MCPLSTSIMKGLYIQIFYVKRIRQDFGLKCYLKQKDWRNRTIRFNWRLPTRAAIEEICYKLSRNRRTKVFEMYAGANSSYVIHALAPWFAVKWFAVFISLLWLIRRFEHKTWSWGRKRDCFDEICGESFGCRQVNKRIFDIFIMNRGREAGSYMLKALDLSTFMYMLWQVGSDDMG